MSRFNKKKRNPNKLWATKTSGRVKPNVLNKAGAPAFSTTEAYELASAICTSFAEDKFYESHDSRMNRIRPLIRKNPKFAAMCAVFARQVLGNRSITHAVIPEVCAVVKGESWVKDAVIASVRRVDDVTEMMSYQLTMFGKPIPNSLKKGLAKALGKFNSYQLAKYRAEKERLSLVDAVNLLHPRPTKKSSDGLSSLIAGDLKNEETWEAMLSAAGNDSASKESVWLELLAKNKLPYFALLKNLRNIAHQAPGALHEYALPKLVNEVAIKKSLILPFRFVTAYKQIKVDNAITNYDKEKILKAISDAVDISTVSNLDRLPGKTVVALDVSGSMVHSRGIANPEKLPGNIGALFAASILKANPTADLILFDAHARKMTVDRTASVMKLNEDIRKAITGGSTDIGSIFSVMTEKYDNIIVLTDNESWSGTKLPDYRLRQYKERTKANPKIFSFDLAGNGTLQFPQEDLFVLFGFSEKVLALINHLINDKEALLNAIRAVNFSDYGVREEDQVESDT